MSNLELIKKALDEVISTYFPDATNTIIWEDLNGKIIYKVDAYIPEKINSLTKP